MTNKEATYILEDIKRSFATREDGTLFTATYNALNKEIKLLEQIPDEHGDLIDRDALKEKKVYSIERHENVVPVAYIDWEQAVIKAEKGKR